ncbi:MAG: PIN domain-containing protein [Rhodococcus sp. (in: high G+C Gram-positive bacteria)]|uniref:PIN domain-containing protein n=1 Tax=Rhodococcus sp. TaxID=1831 RepID=UPI003BB1F3CF
MIIVLDTSAVTRDSRFESFVRTAVGNGLRVMVPRLVLVEIAHRYQRESAAMIEALTVQARMYDRLGLREDLSLFVEAARAKADGYADTLARELEAIGIEVVSPAVVSHVEIFERALQRRRPFFGRKSNEGYPATVNWLTVLDVADRRPGDEVVWVSANSRSFGGDEPSVWHEEIAAELYARGLDGRVWWATDLGEVIVDHDGAVPLVVPEPPHVPARSPDVAPDAASAAAVVVIPAVAEDRVVLAGPPASQALPPGRVTRPRVAPQRIPPAPKSGSGRRGLGKVIGGRKRKVTIVDDLDDVDFG